MDDQYYVGISQHYKKAHILLSSSILNNSFKTLCEKQLVGAINLINPNDRGICESCAEADTARLNKSSSLIA